ncbi:MAG: hypothetical protein JSW47_06780 [Phycisphaerales bacterium]|nr:MAG: hypothetical protein JSW47_06780 [Phycisphaerales bacterium]
MPYEPNQEPTAHVELKVNGREIELNDFVESFISLTVIGMVKSLKGISRAQTVSLEISRPTE